MKKTKTLQKRVIYSLALGLLALAGYFFSGNLGLHLNPKESLRQRTYSDNNPDYNNILVKRVVDGDTLFLENREYVRLLGIDTPEMHESAKLYRDAQRSKRSIESIKQDGRKAYEFTKQLVEGKRVRLEFDWQRYDKYNRILAYVFLEDGTLVNAQIVEAGYAVLTNFRINATYADLFLKLYHEARENKRGLWAED